MSLTLFVSRLKDEFDIAFDASIEEAADSSADSSSAHSSGRGVVSPFLKRSPAIFQRIAALLEHVNLSASESLDFALQVLNFYRYLLLKDRPLRLTPLWRENEGKSSILSKPLGLLQVKLDAQLVDIRGRLANSDQQQKEFRQMRQMGFASADFTLEQFNQTLIATEQKFLLVKTILDRVFECMNI